MKLLLPSIAVLCLTTSAFAKTDSVCRSYVKLEELSLESQKYIAVTEQDGAIAYSETFNHLENAAQAAFGSAINLEKLGVCKDAGRLECKIVVKKGEDGNYYSGVVIPGLAMSSRKMHRDSQRAAWYALGDLQTLQQWQICRR